MVGVAGARVSVEIRSVNHRYLDARVRGTGALADHAHAAEEVLRRRLVRGRVELTLTLEGERAVPRLDLDRAASAFAQLAAVAEVEAMRAREGALLRADFERRLDEVISLVARIEARLPEVMLIARVRLRERIARLLDPATSLDAGRLEHEIALFVDRTDVAEECTRLRAHVAEVRRVVSQPGVEGRGKRLDFLCQELAREANTLGQKSADAEIGARVIDLKQEIERMREQAQNVL